MEEKINEVEFDTSIKSPIDVAEHIYETIRDNELLCSVNYECNNVAIAYEKTLVNKYNYVESAENGIQVIKILDPINNYHYLVAVNTLDGNVTIYYAYGVGQKITKMTVRESDYNKAVDFFRNIGTHFLALKAFENEYYEQYENKRKQSKTLYELLKEYINSGITDKPIIQEDDPEKIKMQLTVINFIKEFNIHLRTLVDKSLFEMYETDTAQSADRKINVFDLILQLSHQIFSTNDFKLTNYAPQKGGKRKHLSKKRKTKSKKYPRKKHTSTSKRHMTRHSRK